MVVRGLPFWNVFLFLFFSLSLSRSRKFRLSVAWPPIKISDLDKIHMVGRGLLQKHFSKTFLKISAGIQK